jgi:hypothetical protein
MRDKVSEEWLRCIAVNGYCGMDQPDVKVTAMDHANLRQNWVS